MLSHSVLIAVGLLDGCKRFQCVRSNATAVY